MFNTPDATERRQPGLEGFDAWENERILSMLLAGQRHALDAVEHALPALSRTANAIVPRLAAGGRLVYAGAGTSIRVAVQDGAELPATFGMKEEQIAFLIAGGRAAMFDTLAEAEDDAAQGKSDGATCAAKDVLVAVAASGRTPYTLGAARAAKSNGCLVIAVVNNALSPLAAVADIEILLDSGPEVISGSTRMGAGTSQKAALNLLSTLVNTRLGAVYDGLMVNVEAGNSKLAARAANIVCTITGAPPGDAAEALRRTGGQVKPAVLVLRGATSAAAAQKILSDAGGNLRLALARMNARA